MGAFRQARPLLVVAWVATTVAGTVVVAASIVGVVLSPPSSSYLLVLVAAVYFAARPMVVLRHPSRVFVEVGSAFSLGALYI